MTTHEPTILVDMDGVLADFNGRCWDLIRLNGWRVNIEGPEQQRKHYITDHMIHSDERRALRRMIDQDPLWFKLLQPIEGAIEGFHALADYGYDLWLVTKPLEANRFCRDDKAAWVRQYLGGYWEKRLILAPDKSMVKGGFLLDDNINPQWLERAQWEPVTFDQPYNRGENPNWMRWSWGDQVECFERWWF